MTASLCDLVDNDLRQFAARLLVSRGLPERALALSEAKPQAFAALRDAGVLGDPDFMRAMVGRTGMALLADRLPVVAGTSDRPSLLARLAEHRDGVVAAAAGALLAADARRRDAIDGPAPRNDIAAERQHQLVWWVAAVLHRAFGDGDDGATFDSALTESAERALAVHDEGERSEAAAMRLVAMLAPQPNERGALLAEALADARPGLFVALLAQAAGIDPDVVRDVLLDPDDDRLWLMLRAAAVERDAIARIGVALGEAMAGRDVESFADRIDAIMAVTPAAAEAALRPLRQRGELRAACDRLGRRQ